MRILMTDAKLFKETIDAVSELITEGVLQFKSDGIELKAMDPASVAMVLLKILSSSFAEYNLEKEENIGLSISNLLSILKRAKPNDQLILELEENKFKITMKGDSKRIFTLPILENIKTPEKVPNLQFDNRIELNPVFISDGIKDASLVSDSVLIHTSPEAFQLIAKGDTGDVKHTLPKESIKIETDKESKAKYSTEYLSKMLKATKLAEKLTIQFKSDFPLKLECVSPDKLQLTYILAPRVENE